MSMYYARTVAAAVVIAACSDGEGVLGRVDGGTSATDASALADAGPSVPGAGIPRGRWISD